MLLVQQIQKYIRYSEAKVKAAALTTSTLEDVGFAYSSVKIYSRELRIVRLLDQLDTTKRLERRNDDTTRVSTALPQSITACPGKNWLGLFSPALRTK